MQSLPTAVTYSTVNRLLPTLAQSDRLQQLTATIEPFTAVTTPQYSTLRSTSTQTTSSHCDKTYSTTLPNWPTNYKEMEQYKIIEPIKEGRHEVFRAEDKQSGQIGYLKVMGTSPEELAAIKRGTFTPTKAEWLMRKEFAAHTTAQTILGEKSIPNIAMVTGNDLGGNPQFAIFTDEVRHCVSIDDIARHHGCVDEVFYGKRGRMHIKLYETYKGDQLIRTGIPTYGRVGLNIVTDLLGDADNNSMNGVVVVKDDIQTRNGEDFLVRKAGRMVRFDWECAYQRPIPESVDELVSNIHLGFLEPGMMEGDLDLDRHQDVKAGAYKLIANMDPNALKQYTAGIADMDFPDHPQLRQTTLEMAEDLAEVHKKFSKVSQELGPPKNPLIVHQINRPNDPANTQ